MAQLLYSRPKSQSIAEVLDNAFRIFQRTLLATLPLGVLTILLGQAPNIYLLLRGKSIVSPGARDTSWWALLIVGNFLVALVWYALLTRQGALIAAQPTSLRRELAGAVARFPQIALLLVLQLASVAAGAVALVIPAIYLLVSFSQSWPAFALNRLSAIDAYKAGVRLTFGNWWRVTTIGSVALIVIFVFYLVGTMIIGIVLQLARAGDLEVIAAASSMMMLALGAVLPPFYSALLIAIHFDLEARQRDLLEREMAERSAAAPAGRPATEVPPG